MSSTPAEDSDTGRNRKLFSKNIVVYGLIALFLCLTLPWELFPYPFYKLSFVSTGAGDFLETRLFVYICILILTVVWLLGGYLRHNPRFQRTVLDLPMGLFLLVALLSMLRLTDLFAGIDTFFLYLSYILFFYLVLNNVKSPRHYKLFIHIFIIAGTVMGLYGIFQYLAGFGELEKYIAAQSLGAIVPSRIFTIFVSPNHLAGFLIMIIPLAFVLVSLTQKSWKRILLLVALVIMLDCVFLTYSRGGWISLGLVFLVLIIGYLYKKKPLVLANLLVIAVLVISTTFVMVRVESMTAKSDSSYSALEVSGAVTSAQGRFLLWRGTSQIIKAHPLMGIGVGAFASAYPFYQYGGLYSKHAHSAYLEIFAEMGIFGFILILIVFFLIFRKGLKLVKHKEGVYGELAIGLLAGASGFMFHSIIDFHWSMASAGILFWGIAALIFVSEDMSQGDQKESVRNKLIKLDKDLRPPWHLLASAVALVFIFGLSLAAYALSLDNRAKRDYQHKEIDSAVRLLEKAIQYNPINPDHQNHLARLYFEKAAISGSSKPDRLLLSKAIKREREAVRLRPYWADYHGKLGFLYFYEGNNGEAIKYFKKAEELYPKKPLFRVLTGEFYLSRKKYKEAEVKLEEAISLQKYYRVWYPEYIINEIERAHFDLGLLYKEQKKFKQAEKEFREVLEINPDNKTAQKELKDAEDRRL